MRREVGCQGSDEVWLFIFNPNTIKFGYLLPILCCVWASGVIG